jgi:hypothetical protein
MVRIRRVIRFIRRLCFRAVYNLALYFMTKQSRGTPTKDLSYYIFLNCLIVKIDTPIKGRVEAIIL